MWEGIKSDAAVELRRFLEHSRDSLNDQYANANDFKTVLPLILGFMLVSVLPGLALQETDDGVPRVDTRLVLLDVIVRDDDGLVEDLTAEDFTLFDDGVERPVAVFTVTRSEPDPDAIPLPDGVVSNRRAVRGIAVGQEVMCRMGLVAQKGTHDAGFHPTAVIGAMGATAGVAAAARATVAATTNALGIAGSMASGIIEYLADGSWTERMHAGWAAQPGLRALAMGRAGFKGPATVFEGTNGFFHAFAPSVSPDLGLLTADLGERWETERLAFKPFACGTMAQPFVDCAIRLGKRGIRAEDVSELMCRVGEGTVDRLWKPLDLKRNPRTAYAAKFSTPYCIAVAFLRGNAGLADFDETLIQDPGVLALSNRVAYTVDPDDEYPRNYSGHIRATLTDGTVVEEHQGYLRGGVREPMERAELIKKCAANLSYGGGVPDRSKAIAQWADRLHENDTRIDLPSV